jgi:hypothetical protein
MYHATICVTKERFSPRLAWFVKVAVKGWVWEIISKAKLPLLGFLCTPVEMLSQGNCRHFGEPYRAAKVHLSCRAWKPGGADRNSQLELCLQPKLGWFLGLNWHTDFRVHWGWAFPLKDNPWGMGYYQNTKPHHPKPSQRPLIIINLGQNTWEELYIILKP